MIPRSVSSQLHDEFAKVNEKWGMKTWQQHRRGLVRNTAPRKNTAVR